MLRIAPNAVQDLAFEDGDPPPDNVIDEWLKFIDPILRVKDACVAVHCVAGLGRCERIVPSACVTVAQGTGHGGAVAD